MAAWRSMAIGKVALATNLALWRYIIAIRSEAKIIDLFLVVLLLFKIIFSTSRFI
jgi:hypothetical protein